MSLIQILLIIIIIPVTILNIRFLTKGRIVKQKTMQKYSLALSKLSENKKQLGGDGAFLATRYMSDSGNNYLLCKSNKIDAGALVTEKEFILIKPLSEALCNVQIKENKKKVESVTCNIFIPNSTINIDINLAENPHNHNWIMKNIISDAYNIKREIEEYKVERK